MFPILPVNLHFLVWKLSCLKRRCVQLPLDFAAYAKHLMACRNSYLKHIGFTMLEWELFASHLAGDGSGDVTSTLIPLAPPWISLWMLQNEIQGYEWRIPWSGLILGNTHWTLNILRVLKLVSVRHVRDGKMLFLHWSLSRTHSSP